MVNVRSQGYFASNDPCIYCCGAYMSPEGVRKLTVWEVDSSMAPLMNVSARCQARSPSLYWFSQWFVNEVD
jgi:hypothetical protein